MRLVCLCTSVTLLLGAAPTATAQPAQRNGADRLTLDAAIAEALEKNLELIAARVGLSIAEANLITARLRPNPVVSLGADHLDWLGTGFNEENGAGPPEYSAAIDFLFERGAKRARRIEVAEHERAITEAGVLDRIRVIALEVREAFVAVQFAGEQLVLARENAASLQEIVTLNEARVRGGEIAEVELLRSRIAALQSHQAVRAAELNERRDRRRLEQLIGRSPAVGAGTSIAAGTPAAQRPVPMSVGGTWDIQELPRLPPIASSPSELHARALLMRPDLRTLQRARARSQAEIRLQLAQGRIDWTIGAEYRRQQGLAGRGNSVGLFFSTPLPLFDRNQGNIARARHEDRQTDTRVQQLEQLIAGEVELAASQYAAAEATLVMIETDMLTQARDVRDITEYAYRRGEATLIELLDAQRAYNETMKAWNEARAEYARSVFLVRATVGEDQIR